jgi:hypothetical protein
MRAPEHLSEKDHRKAVEAAAYEFMHGNHDRWAAMDERDVVKTLRLWLRVNGVADLLTIQVSPLTDPRYWLVPVWALERWERDNQNVYSYPAEPDEHE